MLNLFSVWDKGKDTALVECVLIKSTYQVRNWVSRCSWTWRAALVWESHSQKCYKYLGGTFHPFSWTKRSKYHSSKYLCSFPVNIQCINGLECRDQNHTFSFSGLKTLIQSSVNNALISYEGSSWNKPYSLLSNSNNNNSNNNNNHLFTPHSFLYVTGYPRLNIDWIWFTQINTLSYYWCTG